MICFHLLVLPRAARKRKSTKNPRSTWSVFTYWCFRAPSVSASPPRILVLNGPFSPTCASALRVSARQPKFLTVKSLFSATCQILNPYSKAHLCYRARRGSASDHIHGASTGCHSAHLCCGWGRLCYRARRGSASGIWSMGSQVDELSHCFS